MTNIQAKLERLFEFNKELHLLLENEEYEEFQKQQELFGDLVKDFLNKHDEKELVSVIKPLKRLKNMVKLLQEQSEECAQELKQQSLSLKRNKNKIQAYK